MADQKVKCLQKFQSLLAEQIKKARDKSASGQQEEALMEVEDVEDEEGERKEEGKGPCRVGSMEGESAPLFPFSATCAIVDQQEWPHLLAEASQGQDSLLRQGKQKYVTDMYYL